MDTHDKLVAAGGALLAVGGIGVSSYASTLYPAYAYVGMYGGLAMLGAGVVMIVIAVLGKKRGRKPPPVEAFHFPEADDSATFVLEDVGDANITGTKSTAKNMMRAKGVKNISADDNNHDPRERRA